MATINLGNIKFKWQGAYNGATAYTVDDVVSYNGSSYICIANSTGNLPTDTSYFEQMSSAGTNGTNGTDLTTTLTTQGDLVYRDGSGLQRLGAGTSGQVLTTQGSGANPQWSTVSSDFVKLASGSVGTGTSVSIDGYYSATYKHYKLIINNVYFSSGSWVVGRMNFGGTANSTSNYQNAVAYGSSSGGGGGAGGNSETKMWIGYWDSSTAYYGNCSEIRIFDPQSTTNYKATGWSTSERDGTNAFSNQGAAFLNDSNTRTVASTGITLLGHNGANFSSGTWSLYGIK